MSEQKGQYVYTKGTKRYQGEHEMEAEVETQLAITLGDDEATQLVEHLTHIINTNNGHGARLVLYTSPRTAQKTGQTFAATSILVQAKRPPQQGNWGNNRGGFQQRGGRREYPPAAQAPKAAAPAQAKRPPAPKPKGDSGDSPI